MQAKRRSLAVSSIALLCSTKSRCSEGASIGSPAQALEKAIPEGGERLAKLVEPLSKRWITKRALRKEFPKVIGDQQEGCSDGCRQDKPTESPRSR